MSDENNRTIAQDYIARSVGKALLRPTQLQQHPLNICAFVLLKYLCCCLLALAEAYRIRRVANRRDSHASTPDELQVNRIAA